MFFEILRRNSKHNLEQVQDSNYYSNSFTTESLILAQDER